MSDDKKVKESDIKINLDDLVVASGSSNITIDPTYSGSSQGILVSDDYTVGPNWPDVIDHSEEIAELKKEIQALKDMLAEHIMLGH